MEEKVLDILKDKPIMIPRFLFKNYKRLNISEEELVILIYLIDSGNKVIYNPIYLANELDIDKFKIMGIINSLIEKKVISLVIETNNNIKEEYISLDLFYLKIFNLLIEKKEEVNIDNSDIFSVFEQEFGRTLSPMEIEIIKGWLNAKYSYDIIIEALKESVYNGVNSLRYVDKILCEWNKKGLKTKEDIIKDKEKYHQSKKDKKEVFNYNWLEDE